MIEEKLITNWETEIRRGVVQLLVCAVLFESDLHGKEICDRIWTRTEHIIEVPLGTVYPLLRRYVSDGLIETYKPEDDQRKTIYKLNQAGQAFYGRILDLWNRYSVAVSNVIHYRGDQN